MFTRNVTLLPPPNHELSDDWFFDFCVANRNLRIERNANGEIVIMPPTGGDTGRRNTSITGQLWAWNRRMKLGVAFDSSTGFHLPNGADRAPDAAWIPNAWWERFSPDERARFLSLSPLFAIELRSRTDRLDELRAKMREYLDNGTELGWLLDPKTRTVEIYRPGAEAEVLDNPTTVSADPVLPEFALELSDIF
ncbi:MAG: Uma2 family endonuclease [Geitlerinemataceae cyanobacterium]